MSQPVIVIYCNSSKKKESSENKNGRNLGTQNNTKKKNKEGNKIKSVEEESFLLIMPLFDHTLTIKITQKVSILLITILLFSP